MKKMTKQKGFTLIELMIVVAIIAILAAIAIPQYQNYVVRAQLSRAFAELSTLKTAVEVCLNDGAMNDQCNLDTVDSDMMIARPTIDIETDPLTIDAVISNNASGTIRGAPIQLYQQDDKWLCDMSRVSIPTSNKPAACR